MFTTLGDYSFPPSSPVWALKRFRCLCSRSCIMQLLHNPEKIVLAGCWNTGLLEAYLPGSYKRQVSDPSETYHARSDLEGTLAFSNVQDTRMTLIPHVKLLRSPRSLACRLQDSSLNSGGLPGHACRILQTWASDLLFLRWNPLCIGPTSARWLPWLDVEGILPPGCKRTYCLQMYSLGHEARIAHTI